MHASHTTVPARRLLARIGLIAGLAVAGLSLGGCIVYAPPHYHHWGYY